VAVAANCCVPPRLTLVVEGVTAIEATVFVLEPVELPELVELPEPEPQPETAKPAKRENRQRDKCRKY
jgi:hypothetical protein